MTKVNTVLEAHQNARSWARVPRAILSSAFKSRFFTCCWLPFCFLGHLSSFSDTHSPGRAAALGQPGQTGTCVSCVHTSTLPEVLGFAEARNMSSLDSVGWLWKHSTAAAFPSGNWGGNLEDIWESLFLYLQHWWISIWIFNSRVLSSESTEFAPCWVKEQVFQTKTPLMRSQSSRMSRRAALPLGEPVLTHWVPWFSCARAWLQNKGCECCSHTWV